MDKENKRIGPKLNNTSRTIQSRYLQSVKKPGPSKINAKQVGQSSKGKIEKSKTSTPEKEEQPSLMSLDLSCISVNSLDKPLPGKRTKGMLNGQKKNLSTISEKHRESAVQNELDKVFGDYLQTLYLEAASRTQRVKAKTQVEHSLMDLQGRLLNRQGELLSLQKNLQTISVNSEIQSYCDTGTSDCAKILEHVTAANCDDYISHMTAQLEGSHDRLLLKKVQPPQSDGRRIQRAVTEMLETFDKLQEHCNLNEYKTKIKCIELEETCNESLKRCAKKMSQVENLALFSKSLQIDGQKVDDIPNPFIS